MTDRYDDRDRGRYDDRDRDRGRYDDRDRDRGRYDDRDRDRGRYDDRDRDRYDRGPAKRSKGPWIAGAVVLIVLALVAGVLVSGVLGGDDDETAAAGEILLEPTSFSGSDAFSDEPLATEAPPCVEVPDGQGPPCSPAPSGPVPPPQSTSGGRPGLYGGTNDNAKCDPQQLVDFLAGDPAKAQAWVDALNSDPNLGWSAGSLTVADIPAYVAELTELVLTADTRVTNHGFVDGRANPINSVLQAGSAVLVDKSGTPRVKCYCGNPLLPADLTVSGPFTGTAWPDFDPSKISVVTPSPRPMESFEVVGPDGELTTVETGIAITGTGQVAEPEDETTTTAPEETTTTAPEGSELEGTYGATVRVIECERNSSDPCATDGTNVTIEVTCASASSCDISIDGTSRTYAASGGTLTMSSPSREPFTCDGVEVPTTLAATFTIGADGSLNGRFENTAPAVPPSCPNEFRIVRELTGARQ